MICINIYNFLVTLSKPDVLLTKDVDLVNLRDNRVQTDVEVPDENSNPWNRMC